MGIGVSIFLFAVGAILAFAVHVPSQGIDLSTVGVILMIVGLIGGLLSLMFWSSWGGFATRRPYPGAYVREHRVITDRPYPDTSIRDDRVVTGRPYPEATVREEHIVREDPYVP